MSAFVKPTPDTVWVNPLSDEIQDLEWGLRYGGPVIEKERLMAAGAIACFRELVRLPRKEREAVIRCMRQEPK